MLVRQMSDREPRQGLYFPGQHMPRSVAGQGVGCQHKSPVKTPDKIPVTNPWRTHHANSPRANHGYDVCSGSAECRGKVDDEKKLRSIGCNDPWRRVRMVSLVG